ncbi:MAG: DUF2330 domain-containing protein, partial [Deltaproteobacteria bacterium]|nr:DUF2330 domain-containing protein [Deltaproteobacteria bacterium]
LDTWLRQNGYAIPDGAGAALAPYVQSGMKFFVAKVDVTKVTFEDGRALLSPLRVHYQSEDFSLPIRLGMLNSSGTQDLIVHVLGRNLRYEAASYENVNIPTNLEVADGVRESFGGFYAALFDKTIEQHPGAVVTEYAWQATGCDPCPGPVLSERDLLTLGADVALGTGSSDHRAGPPGSPRRNAWLGSARSGPPTLSSERISVEVVRRIVRRHINEVRFCHESQLAGRTMLEATVHPTLHFRISAAGMAENASVTGLDHDGLRVCLEAAVGRWVFPRGEGPVEVTQPLHLLATSQGTSGVGRFGGMSGQSAQLQAFVLTRLHYRYGRGELGADLVLRPAPAIAGGRGVGPAGELPTEASHSGANNFQGRYIIRHAWEGEVACDSPRRGMWGGPPSDQSPDGDRSTLAAATNLGTQARGGVQLAALLKQPLPALGLTQVGADFVPEPEVAPEQTMPVAETAAQTAAADGGCGSCSAAGGPAPLPLAFVLALWILSLRRRRRRVPIAGKAEERRDV